MIRTLLVEGARLLGEEIPHYKSKHYAKAVAARPSYVRKLRKASQDADSVALAKTRMGEIEKHASKLGVSAEKHPGYAKLLKTLMTKKPEATKSGEAVRASEWGSKPRDERGNHRIYNRSARKALKALSDRAGKKLHHNSETPKPEELDRVKRPKNKTRKNLDWAQRVARFAGLIGKRKREADAA